MTDLELIEWLERCVKDDCDNCPYRYDSEACLGITAWALDLIKYQMARLDTLVNDSAAMPNYEEINRKLEEKLCEAEIVHERIQRDLSEAQKELAHLRAVKATAEAFLGRKIEVK